jgi:Flp pilus assembly protein TadG
MVSMRFFARRSREVRQRGSAVVEFVLVLPILVIVTFGAIDAGRFVAAKVELTYACIKGARLAAVSSTTAFSTVQTAVVAAAPLLNLSTTAVHFQVDNGTADDMTAFAARASGHMIRVYASYNYQPMLVKALTSRTVSASAQTVIQ